MTDGLNNELLSWCGLNNELSIVDAKLTWSNHVAQTISKAKRKLYGLRLLKRYFNQTEMRNLLDSYFYSVLYYNANVWLTANLKSNLKQNLLSISANALKSCLWLGQDIISFDDLHKINGKCTPNQIAMYQRSLSLYKVLNANEITFETVMVLNQIVCFLNF